MRGVSLVITIVLFLTLLSPGWAQNPARLREVTEAIAKGAENADRRKAITDYLAAAGIEFHLQDFVDVRMRKGTNIIATIPGKTSKTLLLGAHYDRAPQGQGAVDNGAGCAVLLDLIETVKSKPLVSRTLQVVFFDLEEVGLRGSEAYFGMTRGEALPSHAINVDIFGYGDAIFATASAPDGPLLKALRQAGTESKIPVRISPPAQYPSSDHINMIAAGVETVGVALIGSSEIDAAVDILENRNRNAVPPLVLTIIHSPRDTAVAIHPEEMERAMSLLERTIRLIEEQ